MLTHQTLFKILLDTSKLKGPKTPIAEDIEQKPMSYRELILRSFILGKKISAHSHFQEHIGILLPNMIITVVSFFALQAFGRIPTFLNFSSGHQSVLTSCEMLKLKQVISSKRFINKASLDSMIEHLEAHSIEIIYLEDIAKSINIFDKLFGLLASCFPNFFYRKIKKLLKGDDEALILFTSGSEGTPKGVALSHNNIQANRKQILSVLDFNHQDLIFNPLPLFHSFGLTVGMLLPILSGLRCFLYPTPLHYHQIPELIKKTQATILFSTDTFLNGYAHYANSDDFSSLRLVFAGGEKLKSQTRLTWNTKFKITLYEGYGVTEASPVLSLNTPMRHKEGTVGCFAPEISYQLDPVEGISEGGRLLIQGPNIMLGYYLHHTPGILKKQMGWYDTGDITSIDEEGFIRILGRAKRFAKVAGEMISLLAVENFIHQIWPLAHHAVISEPDPIRGEMLVLITNQSNATRTALIHQAQAHGVAEISIPKKIVILSELPLLPTGKIDYTKCRSIPK